MICRLENYKAPVCLFIKNLCVPFDKNQAGRDLRMIKVKTKVSGCFHSEEGAQEYLIIMSYIGTAHKHGGNAFTAIREALNGNSDIIFAGGSEQLQIFNNRSKYTRQWSSITERRVGK